MTAYKGDPSPRAWLFRVSPRRAWATVLRRAPCEAHNLASSPGNRKLPPAQRLASGEYPHTRWG